MNVDIKIVRTYKHYKLKTQQQQKKKMKTDLNVCNIEMGMAENP